MTKTKKLVANADDFGLHQDINLGIIEAYREGIVRSTSLMVNGPAVQHAHKLAVENPGLEIGIHLNLSSHKCVAPPSKIDLLADPAGNFILQEFDAYGSMLHLREMIHNQPRILDQIAYEFNVQIEKFISYGFDIGHINVHQYLSLIHPAINKIYSHLVKQLAVPGRGLCYPMLEYLPLPSEEYNQIREQFELSGLKLIAHSISNLADAQDKKPLFPDYCAQMITELHNLAISPTVQTVEVITHPAIISEAIRMTDDYVWARDLEFQLVLNSEIKKSIEEMGYIVCGYQQAF